MRNFLVVALMTLIPSLLSAQGFPTPPTSFAWTHVTVIDATGAPARPGMTVLVRGNRIAALGESAQVTIPPEAEVINATGKYIIPGLWDMHGHLTDATESAFPNLVMNGVTGVRDLGGDLDQIDRWRAEIAAGRRLGPRIFRAGPFVDGPKDVVKDRLGITTPERAVAVVDSLKERGVDFIKIHNLLPRDAFFALAEEARRVGLPLAVHLPHGITLVEASDAGARTLEHIEMFIESALYRPGATAKTWDEAYAENTGAAGEATFKKLVENHTWYVPTLVAYRRGFVHWGGDPRKVAIRRNCFNKLVDIVSSMRQAGVGILAGSDFTMTDNGMVPGVDLHEELVDLVEAGFTPLEAIQAATISPARCLGIADSLGTVEVGKIADFLVLDDNPLENINKTRMIHAVVLGGRVIPIADLRRQIVQAAIAR